MDWKGDQLQAAFFLRRGTQLTAAEVWKDVFGGSSDSFQRDPATGVSNASGARQGRQLGVVCQLGRVDISCLPAPLGTQEEFPQIENVSDALKELCEYSAKFAAGVALARTALVATLSTQVANSEEGIKRLRDLTGVNFPVGTIDPVYQFNVRTPIGPKSIEVNRLCTWSAGEAQLLTVAAGGGSPIVVVARQFASLKVDVNTVPQQILPDKVGAELFSDLAKEILDIADRGIEAFK
ncbi:hypothetical protein ACVWXO_000711 [Bradyrhizobium sp. LM2.7]